MPLYYIPPSLDCQYHVRWDVMTPSVLEPAMRMMTALESRTEQKRFYGRIDQAIIEAFTPSRGIVMPDTSGPAFPTSKPLFSIDPETGKATVIPGSQSDEPGVTRRLWLMANAPPPPDGWIKDQLTAWGEADAEDRRAIRTRKAKPTVHQLDVQWRFDWADEVLRVADR